MPPVITLLTDFGTSDHYVGAMKGVILSICPEARIVDITHEVTPFSILEGAYKLAQAWKWFPSGTIHVAVVDPGVGGPRRPVIVEAGGHVFVGPDNGIFTMALADAGLCVSRQIEFGGILPVPGSTTFHGRDVFAPCAAHLAAGALADRVGTRVEGLVQLAQAVPQRKGNGVWEGAVLAIDRFGNIVSNFRSSEFAWMEHRAFRMAVGTGSVERWRGTYGAAGPGEAFVIPGSGGYL
jgi:S-adenosylmethionine hydrolase